MSIPSETIQLNPDQRAKLKELVNSGVASHYRRQAEQDLLSEITKTAQDELKISPKIFKKLVSAAYKANFNEVYRETDILLDLGEIIGIVQRNG